MSSITVRLGSGGSLNAGLGDSSSTLEGAQYKYWNYGGYSWREGIRGGKFVRDKTLTVLGWDGIEDTDWENILEEE